MQREWYSSWFDTHYYHLLYAHRSEAEATAFIKKITAFLALPPLAKVLDLGCGKGRHSVTLNECGYDVTGMDLSEQNITAANAFSNDHLRFYIHDSRNPIGNEMYDAIFNLFTSFGYFDKPSDDRKMVESMTRAVKKGGLIIIDFLNAHLVENTIDTNRYEKEINDIHFTTQKRIENNFVKKRIDIVDGKETYTFEEQVKLFKQKDFQALFSNCNLLHSFGDYELNKYIPSSSPRLIMIFRK